MLFTLRNSTEPISMVITRRKKLAKAAKKVDKKPPQLLRDFIDSL